MYRLQCGLRRRPDGCPCTIVSGSTGRVPFPAPVPEQPAETVRRWSGGCSVTGYGPWYILSDTGTPGSKGRRHVLPQRERGDPCLRKRLYYPAFQDQSPCIKDNAGRNREDRNYRRDTGTTAL